MNTVQLREMIDHSKKWAQNREKTRFTAKMSGGFLLRGSSRPRNWTVKLLLNKSVSEPRTPTAYDVGVSFCHGNTSFELLRFIFEFLHLKDEAGDFMKKVVDQKELTYLEWIKHLNKFTCNDPAI